MNRSISIYNVKEGRFQDPRHNRNYVGDVFAVHDPPCPGCKQELDFSIFEDFHGTGQDWIQWRCKNSCGFFKNVEIL